MDASATNDAEQADISESVKMPSLGCIGVNGLILLQLTFVIVDQFLIIDIMSKFQLYQAIDMCIFIFAGLFLRKLANNQNVRTANMEICVYTLLYVTYIILGILDLAFLEDSVNSAFPDYELTDSQGTVRRYNLKDLGEQKDYTRKLFIIRATLRIVITTFFTALIMRLLTLYRARLSIKASLEIQD